jgi:hypothetical protein
MCSFTDSFCHLTTRSSLYRVWVPLHDDGKVPLVSIWIDPALHAFKSCAQEAACGFDPHADSFAGIEENSTDRFDAEDLNSILSRRNEGLRNEQRERCLGVYSQFARLLRSCSDR